MKQVRTEHKSIHAVIYTDRMFCYVIKPTSNAVVTHKKEYALTPHISTFMLYNPTQMSNALNDFITEYNLYKNHLYLILMQPLIQEMVCMHHKNQVSVQELVNLESNKTYYHRYIGPIDERALFYVCSITQTLLLQLQLMCTHLPVYLQAIQPPLTTQHNLYKYLYPHQATHTQVAQKINPLTARIEDLFASPLIGALLTNKDSLPDTNLVYALGSFIGAHI